MRLVLALLVVPRLASAQAVDDFHPALDARGFVTQNSSQTLGHEELSFGLGSLEWGRHLDASVHDMVTATLIGAVGLHAGIPLEIGATLPLGVMSGDASKQYVGDVGLHVKARLVHGLGAIASVDVPTADTQLLGVADAGAGRFRFAINGGVRRRSSMMAMTDYPVGGAAALALVPEKVELVGEVFGTLGADRHAEALGGLKVYLAKNSYMSLAAGRGIDDDHVRAAIAIVFEPKPAAHVAAHVEEVAEVAPPRRPDDGFSDRDNDGIADADDRCPDDPENYNGYQDDDGCPEDEPKNLVIDSGSTLVTLEGIEFELDKATIRPSSFHVLDAVAKALTDNPDILLVEVQGHTDKQGSDEYNLDLSQRRADAVVAYLVAHGVAATRLDAHGYGETQPVDPAHTQAAYRKIRRVVFQIRNRQ
jgi:outer membrane protein OmpA-like peptidoglycan-associated protein